MSKRWYGRYCVTSASPRRRSGLAWPAPRPVSDGTPALAHCNCEDGHWTSWPAVPDSLPVQSRRSLSAVCHLSQPSPQSGGSVTVALCSRSPQSTLPSVCRFSHCRPLQSVTSVNPPLSLAVQSLSLSAVGHLSQPSPQSGGSVTVALCSLSPQSTLPSVCRFSHCRPLQSVTSVNPPLSLAVQSRRSLSAVCHLSQPSPQSGSSVTVALCSLSPQSTLPSVWRFSHCRPLQSVTSVNPPLSLAVQSLSPSAVCHLSQPSPQSGGSVTVALCSLSPQSTLPSVWRFSHCRSLQSVTSVNPPLSLAVQSLPPSAVGHLSQPSPQSGGSVTVALCSLSPQSTLPSVWRFSHCRPLQSVTSVNPPLSLAVQSLSPSAVCHLSQPSPQSGGSVTVALCSLSPQSTLPSVCRFSHCRPLQSVTSVNPPLSLPVQSLSPSAVCHLSQPSPQSGGSVTVALCSLSPQSTLPSVWRFSHRTFSSVTSAVCHLSQPSPQSAGSVTAIALCSRSPQSTLPSVWRFSHCRPLQSVTSVNPPLSLPVQSLSPSAVCHLSQHSPQSAGSSTVSVRRLSQRPALIYPLSQHRADQPERRCRPDHTHS